MSVKRKKAGLVISWHKSFSILAPWRKGKGDRDAVQDSEVVLTKIKLFSNFQERLLMAEDSVSTLSTASVSEQDISEPITASELKYRLDEKSGPDYLSAIFSDSQLPRLYKFESEDSGVELPSGANSPSTPTGSEHSFVVHSRESSCNSCILNSDPASLHDEHTSEIHQAEDSVDISLSTAGDTQDNVFTHSEELSPAVGVDLLTEREQCRAEMCEQLQDTRAVRERTCSEDTRPRKHSSPGACDDMMDNDCEPEPIGRSDTIDSLKDYMDQCCRLSEASPSPLSSGLGYLEHICQLMEKMGQLQETNLRLQRHISSLQRGGRGARTREDFFQQHCSCGAAELAFQDPHKRPSRSECLSPSGTLSDLSTIHEVGRRPLLSTRTGIQSDIVSLRTVLSFSVLLNKCVFKLGRQRMRGLERRSYTEGEGHLGDSMEGFSPPQRMINSGFPFPPTIACRCPAVLWSLAAALVRQLKFQTLSGSKQWISCEYQFLSSEKHRRTVCSVLSLSSLENVPLGPCWRVYISWMGPRLVDCHHLRMVSSEHSMGSLMSLSVLGCRWLKMVVLSWLSENYTWGRVKDLVRKTKLRNQKRCVVYCAKTTTVCGIGKHPKTMLSSSQLTLNLPHTPFIADPQINVSGLQRFHHPLLLCEFKPSQFVFKLPDKAPTLVFYVLCFFWPPKTTVLQCWNLKAGWGLLVFSLSHCPDRGLARIQMDRGGVENQA
ncbi:hypothetical protein F7725_024525 [Dissostichus mawsoni]|uniref:DUF4657 domain-containing protein n=1 Tax=Dissostichus mawsoni TaxID=36200 RepID=A0A7J5XZK3_DISMA|nr:hypothetical protein F7725_024525 [Dissostichus mawsoni]